MKNPIVLLLISFLFLGYCKNPSLKNDPSNDENLLQEFTIQRGTNISHWLSQSEKRGQERLDWFTRKDVEYLASLGFDHIRLPIDEEQLWDEKGNKETEAWKLLDSALTWCRDYDLRTIVDLHILRSHHFNKTEKPLWTDPKEQDKFIGLWTQLSAGLKNHSKSLVAYELMNEAVADDPEQWNNLIARAISEIRKNEPERKILVGSNRWQSANTFHQLRIPENDSNLILSFHFYTPMAITHYKASWTKVGEYTGPVNYPGQIIDPVNLKGLPEDLVQALKWESGVFTIDTLEKIIMEPVEYAKKHKLPLYCGEWGCLPTVPREARLQWYKDMRTIFDKHQISYANWDYKGGFGIFDRETKNPDAELIGILVAEKY